MPNGAGAPGPLWLSRAVVTFFVGLAAFFALGWALLELRAFLILLLVALVFSLAFEPPVNILEERGLRRSLATLVVLLVSTIAVVAFVFLIGRVVTRQVVDLIEDGPAYLIEAETWINASFGAEVKFDQLLAEFNEGGRLRDLATSIAPDIVAVGARVVALLFQLLALGLFTYYLVADGPRLRRAICSMLRPDIQREVLRVWELGITKTGGYIFSRALLAFLSAIAHGVAFHLIDIPSPLALALWVGLVSQFVPVIGTYLAGILPALVAVAQQPRDGLWVLAVVVVYQQVENYLLAPRVTAHTMDIHPAVAFGSVIAGAELLGPIGALLALPLAATGTALVSSALGRHDVVEDDLTISRRERRLSRRVARAPGAPPVPGVGTVAGPDAEPAAGS
jgi:predicted PurR-regulated permease PerM